ncbi:MAG: amidohydrolase family protein [Rhodobacterales bacterium]|nr:amidohydrolase family protein [Rhodobacterales bacterium]
MRLIRARAVFTGDKLLRDAVVVFDGPTVVLVRPAQVGDPAALDGLLVPGLINAHTHLELSWAHEQIPGGEGLRRWVDDLFRADRPEEPERLRRTHQAARDLFRHGTAGVCDISNGGDTADVLLRAGLSGVVQHELLGMDPEISERRIATANVPHRSRTLNHATVTTRTSPHAPYSTPPKLMQAASRAGEHPASIHLAEDPEERRLLLEGMGAFAELLDAMGRPWRSTWDVPGCASVDYLARLHLLGPQLMLVHGTDLSSTELQQVANAGASLCLCPRSNLHITDSLPNVLGAVRAGVSLALGTDSLGSSPDLDVLGEVALLAQRWPELPVEGWLHAATHGGARALRLTGLGAFQPGYRPGALLLEGVQDASQLCEVPRRRWICAPGEVS